jgi:hypothetical protein
MTYTLLVAACCEFAVGNAGSAITEDVMHA